jgi:hypothetical protein
MWTIRIERQGWSGGPAASDCTVINDIEHREATEKLPLIVALSRTHQIQVLGTAGKGLRIPVEDLSVKRGEQLQAKTINLMGSCPQELVVDHGETIELNTCTLDVFAALSASGASAG